MNPTFLTHLATFEKHLVTIENAKKPNGTTASQDEIEKISHLLIDTAHREDVIKTNFDWPTWSQTQHAQNLFHKPETLEQAQTKDLQNLLTAIIRSDKFNEGTIAHALRTGLISRIVKRAQNLIDGSNRT